MFKRVIPLLLISKSKLIKTKKFKKRYYIGDPINTVKVFNEKYVDELVLLDIDASKNNYLNFDQIYNIVSEAFVPIAYGGGIKNKQDAKKIISLGVEKIIINSESQNIDFIKELSESLGAQSVVISLDFKKNFFGQFYLYQNQKKITPLDNLKDFFINIQNYVGEIIVNSVDKDGTKSGFDHTLYYKISKYIKNPLVFCGGAASVADIEKILDLGADGCGVGKLFSFNSDFNSVLISYEKPKKYDFID